MAVVDPAWAMFAYSYRHRLPVLAGIFESLRVRFEVPLRFDVYEVSVVEVFV